MTLGTLSGDKLRNLEELGLLPREATAEYRLEDGDDGDGEDEARRISIHKNQGLPWFDTMVEGSRLGHMKQTMGSHRSRDGDVQVEWEIVEWTDGDDESHDGTNTPNSGKRKLDEVLDDDSNNDERMGGIH